MRAGGGGGAAAFDVNVSVNGGGFITIALYKHIYIGIHTWAA